MKLTLDHVQRLNLHALLGAQRGDVATIRALWALQDKIALTQDEEATIELKREIVANQERVVWNPTRSTPSKDFELTDIDFERIRAAIEAWSSYSTADRSWLQPLVTVFFPIESLRS